MATKLTVEQWEQTVEFKRLSPRQKMWVRSYVETKDPLFASHVAYDFNTEEGFRVCGYEQLSKCRVLMALHKFFGTTPKASLRELVEKAIVTGRFSPASLRAMQNILKKGKKS